MDDDQLEAFGRQLIAEGKLLELREKLGISSNVQAHMAQVQPSSIRSWETGRAPNRDSAIKLAKWYRWVVDRLESADVGSLDLVHVSVASQVLARSYATIADMCQAGALRHVDLGPLGLYLAREELQVPEGR